MKRFLLILLALAQCIALAACGAEPGPTLETTPAVTEVDASLWQARPLAVTDDQTRVWYQLQVSSFYDSDGDGTGDLAGVEHQLDYLKALGIGGILLDCMLPEDSLTGLLPEYGSQEALDSLIAAALERGIRLAMAFPLSSVDTAYPWFQTAVTYLQGLPATEEADDAACPAFRFFFLDRTGGEGFASIPGTNWFCRVDGSGRPLLNIETPGVLAALEEAAAFWLEKGVYGLHFSDLNSLYTPTPEGAAAALSSLCSSLKQSYPDSYLTAPAGENTALFAATGLDSLLRTELSGSEGIFAGILAGGSASAYGRHQANTPAQPATPAAVYTTDSHSSGWYDGDAAKIKLGQAMNLLMSGSVFLSAGEELGMSGSLAAPMYWSENPHASGMCSSDTPPDCLFGTPEAQQKEEGSILRYVQKVLLLRQQNPALARGQAQLLQEYGGKELCVFTKSYDGKHLLVVMNPTETPQEAALDGLTLNGGGGLTVAGVLLTGDGPITLEDGTYTLPPCSILVLE